MNNNEGASPLSDIMEIALADYPRLPFAPVKNNIMSTENSLNIYWLSVPDT